jgi:hypothetical protein
MFAIGAVAEGYPSAGWAAALRHLPAALAIPIGLATASCVLASVVWLAFFASFPRPWLSRRLRCVLGVVPGVFFGIPIVASVIAMIYTPSVLARPWPVVLSGALRGPDTRCCRRHPAAVSPQVPKCISQSHRPGSWKYGSGLPSSISWPASSSWWPAIAAWMIRGTGDAQRIDSGTGPLCSYSSSQFLRAKLG